MACLDTEAKRNAANSEGRGRKSTSTVTDMATYSLLRPISSQKQLSKSRGFHLSGLTWAKFLLKTEEVLPV